MKILMFFFDLIYFGFILLINKGLFEGKILRKETSKKNINEKKYCFCFKLRAVLTFILFYLDNIFLNLVIFCLKHHKMGDKEVSKGEEYEDYVSIEKESSKEDYVVLNEIQNSRDISLNDYDYEHRKLANKEQLNETNDEQKSVPSKEREEKLKYEYYKSNPLKNFAPTKGQKVFPPNSNMKKKLPTMFEELRFKTDLEQDRNLHKKQLRTVLKLNLSALEKQRSPIVLKENSKKVYNEYSKYNITKAIDTSNVESVLKQTLFKSLSNLQSQSFSDLNSPSSSIESKNSTNYDRFAPKSKTTNLLVDAQNVTIKDLDDVNREIRNKKIKLARLENSLNNNSIYRIVNSDGESENPLVHKGTVYNYRRTVKSVNNILSKRHFLRSYDNVFFDDKSVNSSQNEANRGRIMNNNELDEEFYAERSSVLYSSNKMNSDSRYKQRIKEAREKILNEQTEKENLNKMTIIHPFEDTKILINIDKVPSKLLNNLLNKQNTAPRYVIPPMRAFGYFKRVEIEVPTVEPFKTPSLSRLNKDRQSMMSKRDSPQRNFNKYESLRTLNDMNNAFMPSKQKTNSQGINNGTQKAIL
jgi:hypothetical protein